ncbi:MAG: hypothetical protein AVDCRST_MAG77-1348 [uncultured Chloroflexi bacterium]|uniref:Uncharacterized protein n=1 Tax=uncultured Chloroflexota bacterium TaxID=166587 RepID=A0A6J4I044_9CHLR|nr:MAG: hypothetical protein AVDCRST_MAG77-1348 [uncultured Chloroflexota bacterium]
MELREHTEGGYRFLATSPRAPYSAGVVALPGHEIVHATLRRPVAVAEGFRLIERHLQSLGRLRAALCGVELRGAAPYTPEEWSAPSGFNERYRAVLREWGLFVDGYPAVARTNVVPVVQPPDEQVFHAFSYTVPLSRLQPAEAATAAAAPHRSTFVTSGAPEAQAMWASEVSVDERLLSCLDAIGGAVTALGHTWDDATAIDVYLREGISTVLAQAALERIGGAAGRGLHWYLTKTPLIGPYLEADARGVWQEVQVDA